MSEEHIEKKLQNEKHEDARQSELHKDGVEQEISSLDHKLDVLFIENENIAHMVASSVLTTEEKEVFQSELTVLNNEIVTVRQTFKQRFAQIITHLTNRIGTFREGASDVLRRTSEQRKSIQAVSYTHLTLPTNREV